MSLFTESIPINLGLGKAGLTLGYLLIDPTNGNPLTAEITDGFVEMGSGQYYLTITFNDANGNSQGVLIEDMANPGTWIANTVWTKPASGGGSVNVIVEERDVLVNA